MDKSIRVGAMLYRGIIETYERLTKAQQEQVVLIPFENFVVNPWPYLEKIETRLDTKRTRWTVDALKRQRVPPSESLKNPGNQRWKLQANTIPQR